MYGAISIRAGESAEQGEMNMGRITELAGARGISRKTSTGLMMAAAGAAALSMWSSSAFADVKTSTAFGAATVQPAGPRTTSNGIVNWNMEASNNATNSSFGVLDFASTPFLGTGQSATALNSLSLTFDSDDASFSTSGQVDFYFTTDTTTSISNAAGASPLKFLGIAGTSGAGYTFTNPAYAPGGLDLGAPTANGFASGTQFFSIGSGQYTKSSPLSTGTPVTFSTSGGTLQLSSDATNLLLSAINAGTNIRLVATDHLSGTAATWAGPGNAAATAGVLTLDLNIANAAPSNSVLYANTPGTKTATFNIGRTLAGVSTATAITIGNSGTDSAKLLVGTDSSSVTGSASSPLAGGATTLLTVGTSGSVAAGSDINQHVIIHNNSNINDSTDVSVNVTAHVVGVRFIDDTDLHSSTTTPDGVNVGKVLVGTTVNASATLGTINVINDPGPNFLAVVALPGTQTTGGTAAYASITLVAGTTDLNTTFGGVDGFETVTRSIQVKPTLSGEIGKGSGTAASGTAGIAQRAIGFLSVPLTNADTALGNDVPSAARIYISGDFWQPASLSAAITGANITFTNAAPPTADGATGKRASAVINSASADQTGWGLTGIAGTALGLTKTATPTTATVNGAVTFDQTTHLNGTWTSTATFIGQNDQTITGTHANDLTFTGALSQVVSGATAANTGSGSYLLDGGGYSGTSPTLTSSGTFTQTGGTFTASTGLTNNGVFTQSGGTAALGNLEGTGNTTLGSTATANHIKQNSLTVNTAGKVTLFANGSNGGVSTLSTLTINGNGKLDLNDNDMILPYVSASPLATIKGYLATGYNAGNWNGNGLDSTAANGSAGKQTALGIGEATDLGITSLDGVTITGKAVVVKYTYYGDASLDGKVDLGNDFPLFLEGYLGHGSAWDVGDFNYDGVVNNTDFGIYIDGFKSQGGALGDLDQAIISSPLLSSDQKASLLSVVPEPSSLALLALTGGMALRRRKTSRA
jgi:hypothetical protein